MLLDKREFEFEIPENLQEVEGAQEAITTLLEQHQTFVEGQFKNHIAPENLQAQIREGFETLSAQEAETVKARKLRDTMILKNLPSTLIKGTANDLIKVANLLPEDDETTIAEKLNSAFAERPHLHQNNFNIKPELESKSNKLKEPKTRK